MKQQQPVSEQIAALLNDTGWPPAQKVAFILDIGVVALRHSGIEDKAKYLDVCAKRWDVVNDAAARLVVVSS